MRFFIADNMAAQLTTLQWHLGRAYPGCAIWPEDDEPLSAWHDVTEALRTYTDDAPDLVVILDLGLESETMQSVRAGVDQAFQLRNLRPHAVFVAYTQWPELAEDLPRFKETFDGLIDKQVLGGYDTADEQEVYIRATIDGVLRRRAGYRPSYKLKDSLGVRLAAAALGAEGLDALVEEVGHGWKDVEIAALTSGHSGAFVLVVSGTDEGSQQRIIVKCARDRETIESEAEGFNKYLGELGPLGEVLVPFEHQVHQLPRRRGYYYRQQRIWGETLGSVLKGVGWGAEAREILDRILGLEKRCYRVRGGEGLASVKATARFGLGVVDLERAKQSLEFLEGVGAWADKLGQWPDDVSPVSEVTGEVSAMLVDWERLLSSVGDLQCVCQHGDLNVGNVLIPPQGNVVLIDLARLGRWPIGYDIGRLAVMLRMRMTDHHRSRDWVENRLKVWCSEEFCAVGGSDVDSSVCPWAMHCDQEFGALLLDRNVEEREAVLRGYQLGTLWDLIKVLSYGDLSPFKRLWALVAAWRLAIRLGFLKHSALS